ncbi:hypothetical protein [Micromonospora chersina]|uniref:hypothetical protein n=1 Tax=Micromonospora chersina TaxID=47854 RepID=UPI0033B88BAC
MTSVVPVQLDGDDYANEVFGLGAGEGRKIVSTRLPVMDGRLRRVAVFTNKAITRAPLLDSLCRDELLTRQGLQEIAEIEVVDHPNARIGAWVPGDDILVQADLPWLGEIAIWSRVISWTLLSETRAKLTLARSDRFMYGTA